MIRWATAKRAVVTIALAMVGTRVQAAPTNLGPDAEPATNELRTTTAPAVKSGVLEAGCNMSLSGESFSDEKEQAQTAGLELGGKLRYGLLPNLEMKVDAGMMLESGYAQSVFGDNTPKNGLDLREAIVQYRPFAPITLEAGAINQAHLNAPLIVSAQAFPAVLERVLIGSHTFNVEAKAQQAVPTSSTLSTESVDTEQTPTFLTEEITARAKLASRVSVSVFGLHYAFNNLPSNVASQSELYGNTVNEITAKQYQFAYAFNGFSYGAGTKVLLSRTFAWTLDGQVVVNPQAPASYNQGQLASSGFEIGLPGDIDLKPKGEVFFAESDIAPGFYNGSDRGHNNRTGWAADLSATFKKAGFLVGGRYVNADLIDSSLVQSHQTFIMLRFETLYALF